LTKTEQKVKMTFDLAAEETIVAVSDLPGSKCPSGIKCLEVGECKTTSETVGTESYMGDYYDNYPGELSVRLGKSPISSIKRIQLKTGLIRSNLIISDNFIYKNLNVLGISPMSNLIAGLMKEIPGDELLISINIKQKTRGEKQLIEPEDEGLLNDSNIMIGDYDRSESTRDGPTWITVNKRGRWGIDDFNIKPQGIDGDKFVEIVGDACLRIDSPYIALLEEAAYLQITSFYNNLICSIAEGCPTSVGLPSSLPDLVLGPYPSSLSIPASDLIYLSDSSPTYSYAIGRLSSSSPYSCHSEDTIVLGLGFIKRRILLISKSRSGEAKIGLIDRKMTVQPGGWLIALAVAEALMVAAIAYVLARKVAAQRRRKGREFGKGRKEAGLFF